ncbi:hypothetical protein HID58_053759, partial [Brassica napus]
VLQKIVAGILSLVLRPRESRSPLVQTIARELLTCSVFQPLVNYVSPERIKKWTHQPPSREEQSVNQDSGDESHRMPDVVPQRRTEALHTESQHCLKNKSWVLGDNIEKLSSKSFANLLSIANVDEQQKVWDFLSETSKNYSLGESSSWMRPNVIDVILNLADKVFQFSTRGFVRKNTFAGWKKVILLMRDAVDDWFLKKIHRLRNEDTVAHGIRWFQDVRIKFFSNLVRKSNWIIIRFCPLLDPTSCLILFCGQMAYSLPEWMTVKRHWIRLIQMADQLGGEMVVKPSSFEQQLEAGASKFKKFLLRKGRPNNFSEFCKGKSLQDMPKRHLVFHSAIIPCVFEFGSYLWCGCYGSGVLFSRVKDVVVCHLFRFLLASIGGHPFRFSLRFDSFMSQSAVSCEFSYGVTLTKLVFVDLLYPEIHHLELDFGSCCALLKLLL